jgi:dienelactone hydrolase
MQRVVRARDAAFCEEQWFAEQGFAVLVIDGRGTPGRGPQWSKAVFGDTLSAPLDDQVDALDAISAQFPDLDRGRVGIRGWSYGGALAAIAVIRRPDVFHAAVSGAAPHDQRLYDTHWRERFLGLPQQNPEGYDRSSTITEAASLTRPLLLIHGMADDNVVVAHTLRMSAALLAAGRPHQVLPLSGATHMAADALGQLPLHELAFLARSLGVARPDADLPLRHPRYYLWYSYWTASHCRPVPSALMKCCCLSSCEAERLVISRSARVSFPSTSVPNPMKPNGSNTRRSVPFSARPKLLAGMMDTGSRVSMDTYFHRPSTRS